MKPHSEDLLERIVYELGVAKTEAESGRATDADWRARAAGLCGKWRDELETLINAASDADVRVASKAIATQKENAELRLALETARKENADLKAENIALQERTAPQPSKNAPPPPKSTPPSAKPAAGEAKNEETEFDAAMKDVKRY